MCNEDQDSADVLDLQNLCLLVRLFVHHRQEFLQVHELPADFSLKFIHSYFSEQYALNSEVAQHELSNSFVITQSLLPLTRELGVFKVEVLHPQIVEVVNQEFSGGFIG